MRWQAGRVLLAVLITALAGTSKCQPSADFDTVVSGSALDEGCGHAR
jgi:hypothetical protein